MANKKTASWQTLKNYLSTNVDNKTDWENEDIKDYSVLNKAYSAGKLSEDKLAEGQTYLQNYISDNTAQQGYNQSVATAENTARQTTAYNDYLTTRLGTYLGSIQSDSGVKGSGLAVDQQIALDATKRNAFQNTQDTKQTALTSAQETLDSAKLQSSATASNQLNSLASSRDAQVDVDVSNYTNALKSAIENSEMLELDEEGKAVISDTNYQRLNDYIKALPVSDSAKTQLEQYLALNYGNSIKITPSPSTTPTEDQNSEDTAMLQNSTEKAYDYAGSVAQYNTSNTSGWSQMANAILDYINRKKK